VVGDAKKDEGEVLPKTKKQRRVEMEQKREKKARAQDKRRRMELRERGHVVPARGVLDVTVDQGEKRLLSTATKGVVRLFNAVSKAQRDASDASKGRIQAGGLCIHPKK